MSHENDQGYDMLIRIVEQFREDVKEDFQLIRSDIKTGTPREVFEAHRAEMDRRLTVIERARQSSRNVVYGACASGVVSMVLALMSIKDN